MRNLPALLLTLAVLSSVVPGQTASPPPQDDEDVVRITSSLVQTDVVVTDKDGRIVGDLKLEDFEVSENGKRQEVKFMEFVSVDEGRRAEGDAALARVPLDAEVGGGLTAGQLKRVLAFVVDDLTIPHQDMPTVRGILTDFVENQMREGDLVAIVRTVGGKGLLQQFTGDRNLLRRAIASLNVSTHPLAAFNNPAPDRMTGRPMPVGAGGDAERFEDFGLENVNDPSDETQSLVRGLLSLSAANFVIDGMREIPGRKSLILISGGIPIFETSAAGSAYSNVTYLLNRLTNNAIRSGVVVNTMDPRGLRATSAVKGFAETPGRSALGSAPDPNFGRGGSSAGRADTIVDPMSANTGSDDPFRSLLEGASQQLGLATLAEATGGISAVNTNNFQSALEQVLARSGGYYRLAFTPSAKFDNKFRRLEVKVRRGGAQVHAHRGYLAHEERAAAAPRTKEETILAAAKSPLARRDVDVSANIILRPAPAANKTTLDFHLLIDANRLTFKQGGDGKHQTAFDVVGFVYDQLGRLRGGFSEKVSVSLTPEKYEEALAVGLGYSAATELPPGYFQFRAVVREEGTGRVGTLSRYLEVPDLSKGRLTMSSLFLFAVEPGPASPTPLLALRRLSRRQDLRYAALVYNAKTAERKTQLRTQVVISQGGNVLYREPEQALAGSGPEPFTKIGQIGLSKVKPGRYVLSLMVTDALADKKTQTVARSVDFVVVD